LDKNCVMGRRGKRPLRRRLRADTSPFEKWGGGKQEPSYLSFRGKYRKCPPPSATPALRALRRHLPRCAGEDQESASSRRISPLAFRLGNWEGRQITNYSRAPRCSGDEFGLGSHHKNDMCGF